MKQLVPDTVAGRTLVVLIVGLTVSHLLSIALYFTDRTSALMFTGGEHIGERIATIHRLVENSSHAEWQRIVELADDAKLHVTWSEESAIEDDLGGNWQTNVLRDALIAHLGSGAKGGFRVRYTDKVMSEGWKQHVERRHSGTPLGEMFMASLQLSDSNWLNFAAPVEAPQPFWSVRFALSWIVMIVAVIILTALVVRYLTKPLATFARAANRLGVDVNASPLPEEGPTEVRQATKAFNEMQRRLKRFVEDRTQMIAAIAHDLGTPITRLRLRAEFVEEKQEKEKMLSDLDDMEKMVFSALSFARDEASSEPRALVDLSTLLERVNNDLSDAGLNVTLTVDSGAVPYACQPVALRRALTNLIENAVKYGRSARVRLDETADSILICIDDDGPGIPEDRQSDVFKPYVRLEQSRNRETGGSGLGLTVARTIVRSHGGDITLQNRPEGGLRVEVTLPRVRP